RVRALVRTPRPGLLPVGVEQVAGNLGDPVAVGRALADATGAFYVSPHEPDEERLAAIFVHACEAARTRLVFAGVHADGRTRVSRAIRRGMLALLFARAYAPKFRLAERIRRARTEAIVLMPTNFFQNDELFRDELLAGEYVQTLRSVNRVDVRDVGDAAARALLDRDIAPGAYPLVGPVSMSSAEAAATWSTALGRPVRACDFDRFAAAVARNIPGKKQTDFLASFRALARLAVPTDPRPVAATTELLGRPPRSYDAYVRDRVAAWTAREEPRDVG
ncbi:MAG: hypothetical protein HOV81_35120, partial [Kofleriaceae bacterium]|nr:hypothetical protein [Kofleriaceae bacterium]